jgi:hypothetical protein
MAVRAHQIAFSDFGSQPINRNGAALAAHMKIFMLRLAVVEVKHERREYAAAVFALAAGLRDKNRFDLAPSLGDVRAI